MRKVALIGIIVLAAFLRLYNLNSVPPSASLDEASIGWNAYSVLKTGADEFNQFPLISQRGYDDYRRSTYLLLTIPFIAILDLSVLAIRFPAVVLSIFTVLALYGIVRELMNRSSSPKAIILAYLSALSLAISPWHIYISRLGHESNACLSFLVFGFYFFLRGRRQSKFLLVSALFFLLSMISYYTGQIVIPLFVGGIFVLFFRELLRAITKTVATKMIAVAIAILTGLVLWSLFSPSAMIRYRGTSTLSPQVHDKAFSEWVRRHNEAVNNHDIFGALYYNRRVFFAKVLFEGYISHFSYQWLFINTGSDSFKAPDSGLLYAWQLPFILIGIVAFSFTRFVPFRLKMLVALWFVLSPLPASIATQAPHAMRAYNILPLWQVATALGVVHTINIFKKIKAIPIVVIATIVFFSVKIFCGHYFEKFPVKESRSFQYALTQTIPFVLSHQDAYEKIVFSNKDNLYQSYMHFLYQSVYDPFMYRNQGGTQSGGYDETHAFGKFEFRPIHWTNEEKQDTLFIGNPQDFSGEYRVLYEGKYLNDTTGVVVVDVDRD